MKIGERIKLYLQQLNYTQSKLAEGIGVSNAFLRQIINNKRTHSLNIKKKISTYLNIPLYAFFIESDDYYDNEKLVYLHRLIYESDSLSASDLASFLPLIKLIKEKNVVSSNKPLEYPTTLPLYLMPTFAINPSLEEKPKVLSNITNVKIPSAFSDCTKYFLVQIKNDTMEKKKKKNCSVVVSKNTLPAQGSLAFVCAHVNDLIQYIVAYYFSQEDGIILKPANSKYNNISINNKDIISAESVVYVFHQ